MFGGVITGKPILLFHPETLLHLGKTFEVEMSKKTIRLDLPMQIGCFFYQYAQFRMLEFYYDFMWIVRTSSIAPYTCLY
jgi:hypothetical protein